MQELKRHHGTDAPFKAPLPLSARGLAAFAICPGEKIICTLLALFICSGVQAQETSHSRDRVDIEASPWSAITQVNVPGNSRCTGVLIAPQLVVTAAHCLYDRVNQRFARPASVHVVFGYDRGSYAAVRVASAIRLDPLQDGTRSMESASRDWAILDLSEPAPEGLTPMPLATGSPQARDVFVASGFGRDRAHALTAVADCRLQGETGDGLLLAACPIIAGYSGGPMIDDRGHLAGIFVATAASGETPLAIAVPVSSFADRVTRP